MGLAKTELAANWAKLEKGRSPVTASVSARSNAPQAYVEAPVTRSTWPTVEESESAVKAPVPLPWRRPVRVVAPVPPEETGRAELRALRVSVPMLAAVLKRLVEEAVVEKRLVEVAEVEVERVVMISVKPSRVVRFGSEVVAASRPSNRLLKVVV